MPLPTPSARILNESHLQFTIKGSVAHFPWQMHILLWLPLGSGGFILVARRTPHMVDVLCRPYQQNQAWNCGQGCPVMTEFIFLCPHVFSIWPSSKCSPSLHKPPGNSRKSYCTRLGLNVQREPWLITAFVSGPTLNQQVMCLRESMLQMEKQIKFKRRPGFAAEAGKRAAS